VNLTFTAGRTLEFGHGAIHLVRIRNDGHRSRCTGILTDHRMTQSDAWRMLQRRGRNAGIPTAVCKYTFRATGITAYLDNGGSLENAQAMAAHEKASYHKALRSYGRSNHARQSRKNRNLGNFLRRQW
jgi:hypothetical protein